MKHFFTLFFVVGCLNLAIAQQYDLAIGQWKSHLPYKTAVSVAQSPGAIYIASDWGVMSIDKEDESIDFMTKVEGLSEAGMGVIGYNPHVDALLFTYTSSNIDLIKDGIIFNLADIKQSQNISGDRSVNHLSFDGNYAYISTNFGLVQLDMSKPEFGFTVLTDDPVNASVVHDGYIYMATDGGILRIEKNHPAPESITFWNKMGTAEGLMSNYESVGLAVYDGTLYCEANNVVYEWNGSQFASFYEELGFGIEFISSDGPHLAIGFWNQDPQREWNGKLVYYKEGNFITASSNCIKKPTAVLEEEDGSVWYADIASGLRFAYNAAWGCEELEVNAPFSNNSYDIAVGNGEVWISAGGILPNTNYLWRQEGFFSLIDGEWSVYNRNNTSEIVDLYDFLPMAIDEASGNVYAGSFLDGLVEFDKTSFTIFDDSNSSLNNHVQDVERTRVSGLAFDRVRNLWVVNHGAQRPLSVLKTDGSWQSFNVSCSHHELFQVDVDDNNYKWIVVAGNNGGVLVIDDQNFGQDGPTRCKFFNTTNSVLPSSKVNCLAVDRDGDVWVGTNDGVVTFECGSGIFDNDCQGSRRTILQNGFYNFLLVGQDIRSIAVDGANRKWFGTTNGIFVQSPNGETEVVFFDEDNSPLFDNTIIDIAINHDNGEVFIGTNKGVQSLRSEAIEGKTVHASDVYAFPNPIHPDYEGPIAIKGLANDANIKITDVSGQLIYEGTALGGQAIWNGKDYNGRRASSGVYLVYSSSSDNFDSPDTFVTKLLVLN